MPTVFYAWQSDSPNRTNRSLIRGCLDDAIAELNRDLEVDEALSLDHDTRGEPGIPDIANTILRKISESVVFVADMTIVARTKSDKHSPNPNVLIELGYALSVLGPKRIILVMNVGYGGLEHLPFDLRHRRYPISYELTAEQGEISEVRSVLKRDLHRAIRSVVDHLDIDQPEPGLVREPGEEIADGRPSAFFESGTPVAHVTYAEPEDGDPHDIRWEHGPQAYLRLIPEVPLDLQRTDVADMIQQVPPFGRQDASREPNRWGAVAFRYRTPEQTTTDHMVQLFQSGEIWGINRQLFSDGCIPGVAFRELFRVRLREWLEFDRRTLGIDAPILVKAGVDMMAGIPLAYRDSVLSRRSAGCYEESIEEGGMVDTEADITEFLQRFFQQVWDGCNVRYPS